MDRTDIQHMILLTNQISPEKGLAAALRGFEENWFIDLLRCRVRLQELFPDLKTYISEEDGYLYIVFQTEEQANIAVEDPYLIRGFTEQTVLDPPPLHRRVVGYDFVFPHHRSNKDLPMRDGAVSCLLEFDKVLSAEKSAEIISGYRKPEHERIPLVFLPLLACREMTPGVVYEERVASDHPYMGMSTDLLQSWVKIEKEHINIYRRWNYE